MVFLLIVLLIAATFGILGAVLKAALVLILGLVLAVVTLGAIAWWMLKRQARRFFEGPSRSRSGAYDAEGHVKGPPELPN